MLDNREKAGEHNKKEASQTEAHSGPSLTSSPTISLPKGGGAIRGIGEKFAANPVTGTGSMTVPIATSPGRSGFGPQLSLSYDSGAGNGTFGLGWNLSLPSITRKTDKGLPRYQDAADSDVFILSGAEDLVPEFKKDERGEWVKDDGNFVRDEEVRGDYVVRRYRPRIEGLFARIERWTNPNNPIDVFWRSISKDNVTTLYGKTSESRIADPSDESRIFSWLICESYDDKGNAIHYGYKSENSDLVQLSAASEQNRSRSAQRYLKRIKYGNKTPRTLSEDLALRNDWLFEVVLDYGEHYSGNTQSEPTSVHAEDTLRQWEVREDPFSTYRAGFEVRTYRLCRRVLMFHHFPAELGTGDYLVRATHFTFSQGLAGSFITAVTQSGYQLKADGKSYLKKSLPPVEFKYSKAKIDETVRDVEEESLENLPSGLDGSHYQWVDLDGEGLSGVVTEQGGAWFYKRNLSALPVAGDNGKPKIAARFGPLERLPTMPSPGNPLAGQQLLDLTGDGQLDVVEFEGAVPGFFERTTDEGWETFRSFTSLPNVAWKDPNLKFVDLTGDGHADILVTEDEVFTWYPSLAEEGFGPAEKVRQTFDEETGPRLVFADGTQSIYLSDFSGDGLTDLVRIRNGQVCYWPNLGYGRFGAKVTMDHAPLFDAPDQFDQKRIRLADIDGSGVVDIIYLAADSVRLYFNQSGNRWSDARLLSNFPPIDNLSSVQVADLLGNGTACLVWSSPLPGHARRPMRYIDLMGGQKPHLLVKTVNNLGAVTEVHYAPSTKFYLADKFAGTPWITKLPFPVHCVEKVTVTDNWRHTSFSSTCSYHHGYFDGSEREFRGFGRVEQVDVESFGKFLAGNEASPYITTNKTLYQPPVKTITWYHTGAALERERILTQFGAEYFPNSLAALPGYTALLIGFDEKPLPEPDLQSQDLSAEEWREALRACKGMTLRQEIYELDVDQLEARKEIPVRLFSTATHNCHIRRLQPKGGNHHAVFLVTESEALSYNYELDLRLVTFPTDPKNILPLQPDPRVAHTLNLSFGEYGNIQQSVAVGYRRAKLADFDLTSQDLDLIRAVQAEQHLAYSETRYTDDVIAPPAGASLIQQYRLRVPCEVQTYELTGIKPSPGKFYFELANLRRYVLSKRYPALAPTKLVASKQYHERPQEGVATMRLVEHSRTLFFDDHPTGPDAANRFLKEPLPLGTLGKLGLPYEQYKLALTEALLKAVFSARQLNETAPNGKTVHATLRDPLTSGYISGAHFFPQPGPVVAPPEAVNEYWMRSGIAGFAPDAAQHFYLPEKYTDPFDNVTKLEYDGKYDLFIQSSKDARDNITKVLKFDYRVLAPAEMEDINRNRTEAWFDVLGMVVAVAVKGKVNTAGVTEADNLGGYTVGLANPTGNDLAAIFAAATPDYNVARRMLGNATMRHLYHFGEAVDSSGNMTWASRPAGACSIVREQHVASLRASDPPSPLQMAFECSDGMGAVLMKRSQAEPQTVGGNLRWIVSGKTVLNNKGKPVKQYEPYFSTRPTCNREGDPQEEVGVTPLMYYDAAGRLVRTEMPDGTFSRVEFSPWHVTSFDANDTVNEANNAWYSKHSAANASKEDNRAARLSLVHHDTPALTFLDSLGRKVIAIAHNRVADTNGPHLIDGKRYRDERYLTFTKLDAEGKPLWIRDARRNLVMQYISPIKPTRAVDELNPARIEAMPVTSIPCYDIAGNLLFQHSMDAGDRWTINDAAGKPMFAWDSRGNVFMSSYDALHRPAKVELKNLDHPAWIVVGLTQYGEGTIDDQVRNRRGKSYRTFDQSGMITNEKFDFKGNAVRISRRFASDFDVDTDWKAMIQQPLDQEPGSLMMPETLTQMSEHDALNRMTRQYNWHRAGKPVAVYVPGYNERGLLVSEDLTVGASMTATGQGKTTHTIRSISYDAKGQRSKIIYGNDVITNYTYDPTTLRLLTLVSRRPGKQTRPNEQGLQDLRYTYDPSGNITEIFDGAVPTEYFKNAIIEPRKIYVYDALYRLIEATGREHAGQLNHGPRDNWHDCPYRVDYDATGSKVWRNYTQRYTYDSVGNILVMKHILASSTNSWTRQYQYATDSNRLLSTGMGTAPTNRYATSPTLEYRYSYNVHGSMTSMPHLPTTGQDYTEHLRHISRAPASQGTDPDGCADSSLEAWYRYDGAKQRTRKRVKKQGGLVEERFYLGGLEWYRRMRTINGALVEVEEIETLHVFDGEQRLLMVDQVIKTDRPNLGLRNLYRYTLSNHLGSSTVEVDEKADIISYEEYHPYGTTAYQSGRNASEVKLKRYRYTGMERDEESGLNHHGARYYAAWLARWTSTDPSSIRDGLNLYLMVAGNPIRFHDPTGEGGEETFIVEKQMVEVYPKGSVLRFSLMITDPATGDEFRYIADAATPKMNEFMNYLMIHEHKGIPRASGDPSTITPGQIKLFGTSEQPGLLDKYPQGVRARIESDAFTSTNVKGQMKGDVIDLKKGHNINTVDTISLATTKVGTSEVYGTDFPGVKLRQGGRTSAVPRVRPLKATLGGVVAGVLLAPLAANAATGVVPENVQEATYEITSTVVDAAVEWVQQIGPQQAIAVGSALVTAGRIVGASVTKSGVAYLSQVATALTAEVSAGAAATVAVTGAAVVAAVGAVGWAVEDTRRALKGEKTMTDVAVDSWSKNGVTKTFEDLWWQIAN
jgi:RHS repeat-associated protein